MTSLRLLLPRRTARHLLKAPGKSSPRKPLVRARSQIRSSTKNLAKLLRLSLVPRPLCLLGPPLSVLSVIRLPTRYFLSTAYSHVSENAESDEDSSFALRNRSRRHPAPPQTRGRSWPSLIPTQQPAKTLRVTSQPARGRSAAKRPKSKSDREAATQCGRRAG